MGKNNNDLNSEYGSLITKSMMGMASAALGKKKRKKRGVLYKGEESMSKQVKGRLKSRKKKIDEYLEY